MKNEFENSGSKGKKFSLRDFFSLGEVGSYFFRKKDKVRVPNINTRIMHGINKFAIIVFILGMIYFIIKRFF